MSGKSILAGGKVCTNNFLVSFSHCTLAYNFFSLHSCIWLFLTALLHTIFLFLFFSLLSWKGAGNSQDFRYHLKKKFEVWWVRVCVCVCLCAGEKKSHRLFSLIWENNDKVDWTALWIYFYALFILVHKQANKPKKEKTNSEQTPVPNWAGSIVVVVRATVWLIDWLYGFVTGDAWLIPCGHSCIFLRSFLWLVGWICSMI